MVGVSNLLASPASGDFADFKDTSQVREFVSNLLASPASGDKIMSVMSDRAHKRSSFQSISFPSEWGPIAKDIAGVCRDGVSNLLASPASGDMTEFPNRLGHFPEFQLFPIY